MKNPFIFPGWNEGLSKRELCAYLAMTSIAGSFEDYTLDIPDIIRFSVQIADALLAELEKQ